MAYKIREQDSLKAGEEVLYTEDGMVMKVKVLENNSDTKYLKYKFEVTAVVKRGPLEGKVTELTEVGQQFNFSRLRGVPNIFGLGEILF